MKKKYLCSLLSLALLSSCGIKDIYQIFQWKNGAVTYNATDLKIDEKEVDYNQLFLDEEKVTVSISAPLSNGRQIGTGFFYKHDTKSKTYYIVTNYHVIEGADLSKISARCFDSFQSYVSLVGYEPNIDIAILSLQTDRFYQTVELGDSTKLDIGEKVTALGNPISDTLQSTFTIGSVTGLNRTIGNNYNLIQTDVTLNPGNSGGPLFDLAGQLVGINRLKYTTNGNTIIEGTNFSIPITDTLRFIEQIIDLGGCYVPTLSISSSMTAVKYLSIEERKLLNINVNKGVYYHITTNEVPQNGVITSINGQVVEDIYSINRELYNGIRKGEKFNGYYAGDHIRCSIIDLSNQSENFTYLMVK